MKTHRGIIGVAIVAACSLAPISASSAERQEPTGRPASKGSLLKPGFEFVLGDFPSLNGYAIDLEEVEIGFVSSGGLMRSVLLSSGSTELRVRIGVSQPDINAVQKFFTNFDLLSQMDPAERLVSGSSVGLTIGDESLVGFGSTSTSVRDEIAFRRKNIFVSIEHVSEGLLNLLSIATEIDSAINALPDVTSPALDALRPTIDKLSAASTNLSPADETELTVSLTDPQGLSLSKIWQADEGDVLSGPPDRYSAGSLIGLQTLTLVASNSALLFNKASINFNVTSSSAERKGKRGK